MPFFKHKWKVDMVSNGMLQDNVGDEDEIRLPELRLHRGSTLRDEPYLQCQRGKKYDET